MFLRKYIGWVSLGTAMLVAIVVAFVFGLEPAQADTSNDDGEMHLQNYRQELEIQERQARAMERIAVELKEIKLILKKQKR